MRPRPVSGPRAKGILKEIVAGPEGYVTEEYLARNLLILDSVLPDPPRVVVDVGCGYGALATAIAMLTPARVVGLDVLDWRAKAVRDRPQARGRVDVGVANVEAGLP